MAEMKSPDSDDEDMAPPPGVDSTEFSSSSDRESFDAVAEAPCETAPHASVDNANASWMVVDDEDEEMESVQTGASSDGFDFTVDSEDEGDGCVVVADKRISRSFDMKLLRQSIVDGSRILELVKGKEVVMVVGKTGTGKSTLMQALAGKKMSESAYTTIKFGETIEKYVFVAEDPLAGFEIGHVKSSKTRHMNGYAAKYKGKDGTMQELIYIDSPGFEDTEGPEIDIATSAMMSQIANRCHRLRFVILINYVSLLEDRGGAIRGVLKLVRNFVRNFEESKQCFMFLFTHTNEIKDISQDSVDDAKVTLRREIIRTHEGTSALDREVLQVLTFLRVCLEKDYPFVNVFHPLQSDIRTLMSNIEKLKSTRGDYLAGNCGLTPTSKFKLSGELQKLFQDLRNTLLENSVPDLTKAKDIVLTFRSLELYVDINDVLVTVAKVKELFHAFSEHRCTRIQDEVIRGTGQQHEFGPANVSVLQQSLSEIREVSEFFLGEVDVDKIFSSIQKKVASFQKKLLLESIDCRNGIHQQLKTLKVWSDGFSNLSPLYEEAVGHFSRLIQDASAAVLTFNENSQLESSSEDQLGEYVRRMSLLHYVESFSANLSIHLDVAPTVDIFAHAKSSLSSTLESWEQVTYPDTQEATISNVSPQVMVAQAKVVEVLHTLFDEHFVCTSLQEKITFTREYLADAAKIYFVEACSTKEKIDITSSAGVEKQLRFLSETHSLYQSVGNSRWNDVLSHFRSIIRSFKSFLKSKSGELDEMTKSALTWGIKDGRRDKHALVLFKSYTFFDLYLPKAERFVQNCSIAHFRAYEERTSTVMSRIELSFTKLRTSEPGSLEELRSLKPLLAEQREMLHLSGILTGAPVVSDTTQSLSTYVGNLAVRTKVETRKWKSAVATSTLKDDIPRLTDGLDKRLQEIELLYELDFGCKETLASIRSDIERTCEAFATDTHDLIDATYRYPAKKRCLSVLAEIAKSSASKSLCLPDFHKVKETVREGIQAQALQVEKMVSETSKWDEIDPLIEKLERATILDEYTSKEASSRLRSLRMLREQKEEQVDGILEQLIVAQDYSGIRNFILPSANSTDQVKRQKFDQNLSTISSSLSEILGDVNRRLSFSVLSGEDLKVVADGFGKLEQADREIGQYLNQNRSTLRLSDKLKAAKWKMTYKFIGYLNKMKKATQNFDFCLLGANNALATDFEHHMKPFLSTDASKKSGIARVGYRRAFDAVRLELEAFFDSRFERDDLLQILASLKRGSEYTNPELPEVASLYEDITMQLTDRLEKSLSDMEDHVSQTGCFDDAIQVHSVLDRQLKRGLEDHIHSPELPVDMRDHHTAWCEERRNREQSFCGETSSASIESWKNDLDHLDPSSWNGKVRSLFSGRRSYDNFCNKIAVVVAEKFSYGSAAIRSRDYSIVQSCITLLDLMEQHLAKHVPSAGPRCRELKLEAQDAFNELCQQIQKVLDAEDRRREFHEVFDNYRKLVITVPSITLSVKSKRAYELANQLIYEALRNDISELEEWESTFDFSSLKKKIERARLFGGYIADYGTLLHEEVKCCQHLGEDEWLARTFQLCLNHFNCGRDLSRIRLYAVLGAPPSATKKEIKKAYHREARKHHPDKRDGEKPIEDEGAMFRKTREAFEVLDKSVPTTKSEERPFDPLLNDMDEVLRKKIREFLFDQRYDEVEKVLFQLGGFHVLENLVRPKLQARKTINAIADLVKRHVEKAKIEVNSNWTERKYRALNDNITDLRLMEVKFKSYPEIFSASWNTGIVKNIEDEIDSLGRKAREYLHDRETARSGMPEFRRCFINMGFVLVELSPFKEYTKAVMCDVLEACLGHDWGYSYLFDFGLALRKSDDDTSEEESLVAQIILSEFSHFKEVLTMVWNEETSQKPVEVTVEDIRGVVRRSGSPQTLQVEKDLLLNSFALFEGEYKALLGEYIGPEADLNGLVQKIISSADNLIPLTCDTGWGKLAKEQIPTILAGVFAVFTILKSGASYNRVGTTDAGMGEKLLMKPHNIQVLTLLCMFGCSSSSCDSLESQLMQIRTGEGKSMIIGAAAVVFGLLGFRVRCVCYSEFLSSRDYNLFSDVFKSFHLSDHITYSMIRKLSEDTTTRKGNLRLLTDKLLRGQLGCSTRTSSAPTRCVTDADMSEPGGLPVLTSLGTGTTHGVANVSNMMPCQQDSRSAGAATRENERRTRQHAEPPPEALAASTGRNTATLSPVRHQSKGREEILLIDEVDVFFGSDFYGQTYNQVCQLHEPEVVDILQHIWDARKHGDRRLRLVDIQSTVAYAQLMTKFPAFKYLVDNEISTMCSQVWLVDEEPYHLDNESGRIGYKVMDTISYEATYGYRTVFAYMKEAESGNLTSKDSVLANVMAMQVSCGQFSYANISPARILGVSGTLDAMGDHEKTVLAKYGVEQFLFVPSVYGESNFTFDKAGGGIRVEATQSDYFHSITDQVLQATKLKRAAIVFFRNKAKMKEYTESPFFHKLGRQKQVLSEEMSSTDKEFAISKAATAGKVTISSAVFGRGTDFFCKDDRVQHNGGVQVIQAFLSEERSEEVQIQGRTARQGKKGSYQMILLDSDLRDEFGVAEGKISSIAKHDLYQFLCQTRDELHKKHCHRVENNLSQATKTDRDTHEYFDALLARDSVNARNLFSGLYRSFKQKQMPSAMDIDLAFVVDITGSMSPFASSTADTLQCILEGRSSIAVRLKAKFPDIQFRIRAAVMGYRDLDDKATLQFQESQWAKNGGHFTDDVPVAIQYIRKALASPSGGADIAEDHVGAIHRCATWQAPGDWTSQLKFMMLLTDAPAHGMVPSACASNANADNYATRHPQGLTTEAAVGHLIKRNIDLFFCSFNPAATQQTEGELSQQYLDHSDNREQREVTIIPMVPMGSTTGGVASVLTGGYGKHIIFVLDESGSMQHSWSGVVEAYNQYLQRRRQNQCESDLVSVVQFDGTARSTVNMTSLAQAPCNLSYSGGGTAFHPAASLASSLALQTPASHAPLIVFMSDGAANDSTQAAHAFATLNAQIRQRVNSDLELHVIGFGGGANNHQLQEIAGSSPKGKVYASAGAAELSNLFVQIAGGQDVAGLLEAEVGKRISEAVADRLAVEFLG